MSERRAYWLKWREEIAKARVKQASDRLHEDVVRAWTA